MDGTVLGQPRGLSGGFELERLIKAYEAAEKVLRGMPLDGGLTFEDFLKELGITPTLFIILLIKRRLEPC